MDLTADSLSTFFPSYLTEERKKGLLSALKQLPLQKPYYATLSDPEPLQGDGWSGLQILRFEDASRTRIMGIVITNSCDLAADNFRLVPSKLIFAPLISLSGYLSVLERGGVAKNRIVQHADDIRAQAVNSLFFLPAKNDLAEDHVALLFDLYTIPTAAFIQDEAKRRVFRLSDIGFYLFVFKLSIHFCRLHENIDRSLMVQ